MRLIKFDANFLSKKEQVLSPEGNIADNVEISVKSSVTQIEAQMQQLKSEDLNGKEECITSIAQDMSQCSFAVVNPKTKASPGWIMTEGGLTTIGLDGVKLVGYHDPIKRRYKRSVSVSEADINQQTAHFTSSGSHQGPIKDEPSIIKYSDTSKAAAIIEQIWFNVASPENRSQDATKRMSAKDTLVNEPLQNVTLDYNLLTTGTFTIAAWLKQFDELKDKIKAMNAESKMRLASVLTSTLYFFIFAPDRTDYDIRAPSCDFEGHLTPLAKKLRYDFSMRTFMKLFQKLPSADVVVMDYTLQRNLLSLDTLYHALYVMCEQLAKNNRSSSVSGKANTKHSKLIVHGQRLEHSADRQEPKPGTAKKSDRNKISLKDRTNDETRIDVEPQEEDDLSRHEESKFLPSGVEFTIGERKLPAIGEVGEDVGSVADEESDVEDTIDNDEDNAMMTLDNFDVEREKPVKSDEAVQRWLINSERGTSNARSCTRARLTGGIRQSVLPDGVEVSETGQNAKADTFKFSDTVSPGENRDTISVLSPQSSVMSPSPSDEDLMGGASRRRPKRNGRGSPDSDQKSDEREAFNSFKALLQAVKAYKDNAEQYEFTKIFGREVFVCGRIVNFRIDVVSKVEKPTVSKSTRKQRRPTEREPIFYTQNFEVNFSLKEQQSTLRKSTITRLKDRSQRNSLFIDCLITLAKTTYKLDFSVVKLINQIYCSVQKIHEELGWNRVLKDHEINTKAFGTKPSFDNGSHRSSENSDLTEDDEGDDCWYFISKQSQLGAQKDTQWFTEDLLGRSLEEGKDDTPGRIVTHVIASWLAAEFCTEIGGLITRTYFDTFNVSYWGRQSRVGKRSKEVDSNITANMKQLDITVTEADHCAPNGLNQSIMTFVVKNTGFVISSKEKMDKQKRSYIWFNIKEISLNIPLQPSALRQTVDKTSKRITELKSKLAPLPQTAQNSSAISPKEPHASQRSGLNVSGGTGGDNVDEDNVRFGDGHETATDVPINTLKCDSPRETHFKAGIV